MLEVRRLLGKGWGTVRELRHLGRLRKRRDGLFWSRLNGEETVVYFCAAIESNHRISCWYPMAAANIGGTRPLFAVKWNKREIPLMDYYEVNKTIYPWGSVGSLLYLKGEPISNWIRLVRLRKKCAVFPFVHIVPKQQITCHLHSEELV